MRYSFHFHDRPDGDHEVELITIDAAKDLALQSLLGVARDEAFTVPFELTLSVNDDTKHQVYRVTLRVECEPQ